MPDFKVDSLIAAITKRALSGYASAVEALTVRIWRSSDTPLGTAALLDTAAGVPIGGVIWYAGSEVPAGYLLADGRAVSRTEYSALFSAIGTTWGVGDGAATYNIPNHMGAAAVGSGGTRVNGPLTAKGSRVDSDEVTLAVANLPEHKHDSGTYETDTQDPHRHSATGGTGAAGGASGTGGAGLRNTAGAGGHGHVLEGQIADAGGSDPVDMRQPWVKMMPLVHTGVTA